jgi:hypothetical protein
LFFFLDKKEPKNQDRAYSKIRYVIVALETMLRASRIFFGPLSFKSGAGYASGINFAY